MLSQSGVGGFSVDEVTRRSGVAKTTIYRHWPSREALVLDAASRISAALIGPLYYRRWFSREPIDGQFVAAIVRNVIGAGQGLP